MKNSCCNLISPFGSALITDTLHLGLGSVKLLEYFKFVLYLNV